MYQRFRFSLGKIVRIQLKCKIEEIVLSVSQLGWFFKVIMSGFYTFFECISKIGI